MSYKIIEREGFKLIGIGCRTKNADGFAMKDIGQLWQRFFAEGIVGKIPNKVDGNIYGVYTNYENGHDGMYTAMVACKVSSTEEVPEGMMALEVAASRYAEYTVRGKMPDTVVQTWEQIEKETAYQKAFKADFDIYDPSSQDPADMSVSINVSLA